jgi:hypothetical protein
MAEELICTFDSQWFRSPPEWWGTFINESEHPVTFSADVQVDGVYPVWREEDIVPSLHVCLFGGYMGFMGAKWKLKVSAPNHRTVHLSGYDPFAPRVDMTDLLARIARDGYGEDAVTASPELQWELYRWRV